jgi:hypothetical protein
MLLVVALRLRRYRVLLGCLVLSLVFHFLIVPLLVRLFGTPHGSDQAFEVVYEAPISTLELTRRLAVRPDPVNRKLIERKPIEQKPIERKPQPLPPPIPARTLQQPARARIVAAHLPVLARTAHRQVERTQSETIDLAKQQVVFEKTIAQLREQDNPVADAQHPVQAPASQPQRYTFNIAESVGTGPKAEGILTPVRSWHDGSYDYYYVQYWVQYDDGTTETGYVPWPIRYLPAEDPFVLHLEHFPLPGPLADFSLPANTNVHPLITFCLEHRDEFSTCPIEHD